jgi:phosphoribosylanthranilate isomerase
MQQPEVKICGTTTIEDARLAMVSGADYLGVIVDHPPSPRSVSIEDARMIFSQSTIPVVAVSVNQSLDALLHLAHVLRPAALQLHGDESAETVRVLKENGLQVWAACSGERDVARRRALEMTEAGADAILIDARVVSPQGTIYGGTGTRGDWDLARVLVQSGVRVVLSGGLSPDNVAEAIGAVQPWMVDVASGVEARLGVKDPDKVRRFIEAARLRS